MVQITGRIKPEYLDTDTQIYLRINQAGVYEAFPVDVKLEDSTLDDGGFCLYLYSASLAPGEKQPGGCDQGSHQGYHIIYSHTFEPAA